MNGNLFGVSLQSILVADGFQSFDAPASTWSFTVAPNSTLSLSYMLSSASNATAVPEPAAFLLVGLVALGTAAAKTCLGGLMYGRGFLPRASTSALAAR